MKTLNDFKDQVARKHGFYDWNKFVNSFQAIAYKYQFFNEAAELYAEYKAKDAWDRACEEQRKICAARIEKEEDPDFNDLVFAIRQLVKKAPKPECEPK